MKTETFWNQSMDKGRLKQFVLWFMDQHGGQKTAELLEKLKYTGFASATASGISLGIDDLMIPPTKSTLLAQAEWESISAWQQTDRGSLASMERFERLIQTWHQTSEWLKQEVVQHFENSNVLNPVYMMAFSGARGNISQVRQLVGMRGLMADPQGQVLDFPIRSNFREGLTLTEYIISCYGARKGIVDTALRTANAGYLTRRLVDVAQHVMVSQLDCGTERGLVLSNLTDGKRTLLSLEQRLVGRVLGRDLWKGSIRWAERNQEISRSLASDLAKQFKRVLVRSPLTCEIRYGICQRCYGWNLAQGRLVSLGEAVGVIAAQSIGEPGTQLTMRTFHTGGAFSGDAGEQMKAPFEGQVFLYPCVPGRLIRTTEGRIAFGLKQEATLKLQSKNQTMTFLLPAYTVLFVRQGQWVHAQQTLAQVTSFQKTMSQQQGEQPFYTPHEGEFYGSSLNITQQLSPYGPDVTTRTDGSSSVWLLFGKVYDWPALGGQWAKPGDYVDQGTALQKLQWYLPNPSGLSHSWNYRKSLDGKIEMQRSVCRLPVERVVYRKTGYVGYGYGHMWFLSSRLETYQNQQTAALQWFRLKGNCKQDLQAVPSIRRSRADDSSLSSYLRLPPPPWSVYSLHTQRRGNVHDGEQTFAIGPSVYWAKESIWLPSRNVHMFYQSNRQGAISSAALSSKKRDLIKGHLLPGYLIPETALHAALWEKPMTRKVPAQTFTLYEYCSPVFSTFNGPNKLNASGINANQLLRYRRKVSIHLLRKQSPRSVLSLGATSSSQFGSLLVNRSTTMIPPKGVRFNAPQRMNEVGLNLQTAQHQLDTAWVIRPNSLPKALCVHRTWVMHAPRCYIECIAGDLGELQWPNGLSIVQNRKVRFNPMQSPPSAQYGKLGFKKDKKREDSAVVPNYSRFYLRLRPVKTTVDLNQTQAQMAWMQAQRSVQQFANSAQIAKTLHQTQHFTGFVSPKNPILAEKLTDLKMKANSAHFGGANSAQISKSLPPIGSPNIQPWQISFGMNQALNSNGYLQVISLHRPDVTVPSETRFLIPNQPHIWARSQSTSPMTGEWLKSQIRGGAFMRSLILRTKDLVSFYTPNVNTSPSAGFAGLQPQNLKDRTRDFKIGSEPPKGLSSLGDFVTKGDRWFETLAMSESGQVIHVGLEKITLRRGKPIRLPHRAILHASHGDLLRAQVPMVTLPFQRLEAGDIVQGIPKIEQYFEARTTRNGRRFRQSIPTLLKAFYERAQKENTPWNMAALDYTSPAISALAARQAIAKIQRILVYGVQRVYRSQGVTISEKHIEVIVRQMTDHARVLKGGGPGMFRGEYVQLSWLEYVNSRLRRDPIIYAPAVRGITRSALETYSFLSAASFQQSTKVLSRSAVERRTDYLRGLKQSVMVGNLIPAGSGFLRQVVSEASYQQGLTLPPTTLDKISDSENKLERPPVFASGSPSDSDQQKKGTRSSLPASTETGTYHETVLLPQPIKADLKVWNLQIDLSFL